MGAGSTRWGWVEGLLLGRRAQRRVSIFADYPVPSGAQRLAWRAVGMMRVGVSLPESSSTYVIEARRPLSAAVAPGNRLPAAVADKSRAHRARTSPRPR